MSEARRILEDHIHQLRDKRQTIFFTASGAGIGYALTQAEDIALNLQDIPLILSVLAWSLVIIYSIRINREIEFYKIENLNFNDLYKEAKEGFLNIETGETYTVIAGLEEKKGELESSRIRWSRAEQMQMIFLLLGGVSLFFWYIVKGMPWEILRVDIWTSLELHTGMELTTTLPNTTVSLPPPHDPQPPMP